MRRHQTVGFRFISLWLVGGFLACNPYNDDHGLKKAEVIRARLERMSCVDAAEIERESARRNMYDQYLQRREFILSLRCDNLDLHPHSLSDDDDDFSANDDDSPGGYESGPDDYAETNTQETGVDESDRIKTDGQYLYYLLGTELIVFDAWPPEEATEVSRTAIEGEPSEMYVSGDRAVVFSSVWANGLSPNVLEPLRSDPASSSIGAVAKITVLDLHDRTAPTIAREIYLESTLVNSRRIDETVHAVLTASTNDFPYWRLPSLNLTPQATGCDYSYMSYRYLGALDESWRRDALNQLERARQERLATIDAWEPQGKFGAYADAAPGRDARVGSVADCSNLFVPSEDAGFGVLSVLSFDWLNDDSPLRWASIKTQGQILYASKKSLYITRTHYNPSRYLWRANAPASEFTVVHKFLLDPQSGEALYEASGVAPGWVLNQFSMSEHRGFLRMATTEGRVSQGSDTAVHSNVFVMETQGDRLEAIGEIDNIAPTEQIYSARFMGDRGFLVTFQKVDPLFTLDLSNPREPRIVGELKIPGFSSYIHLLDANHLMTIGLDAEEVEGQNFAWFQGLQLSIFDVTDFADPKLTHKEVIGGRRSYSPALSSHKYFTWYPSRNALAFPLTTFTANPNGGSGMGEMDFIGLHVYRVDAQSGFRLDHAVSHMDFYEMEIPMNWNNERQIRVENLTMIDDYVYSISNGGLLVNSLESGAEVARIAFDFTPNIRQFDYYYYDD